MNKSSLYTIIFFMGIITATINTANGLLASKIGLFESVLIVHMIGSVIAIIYFTFLEKNKTRSVRALIKVKPYMILGGFIGSVAVVSISYAIMNASVLAVSTALIAGQFIFSFFIDINGWFGFEKVDLSKKKLASLGLMLIGVALISF